MIVLSLKVMTKVVMFFSSNSTSVMNLILIHILSSYMFPIICKCNHKNKKILMYEFILYLMRRNELINT